jgi:hypothetical protein
LICRDQVNWPLELERQSLCIQLAVEVKPVAAGVSATQCNVLPAYRYRSLSRDTKTAIAGDILMILEVQNTVLEIPELLSSYPKIA